MRQIDLPEWLKIKTEMGESVEYRAFQMESYPNHVHLPKSLTKAPHLLLHLTLYCAFGSLQ